MRRKCDTCLCRTCMVVCCDRKTCTGKKELCERYSGFRQLSIFDTPQELQHHSVPRHSWQYYGISKERYRQLTEYIQSGRYAAIVSQAAHRANEMIAEHVLLSITQNLSYEGLEKLWARGEIERMPYCRTDFYGIRRYTIYLFDMELRRKDGKKAKRDNNGVFEFP